MSSTLAAKYNKELVTKAWVEQIIEEKLSEGADYKQLAQSTGNGFLNSQNSLQSLNLSNLTRGTEAFEFVGSGVKPVSLKVRGNHLGVTDPALKYQVHRVLLVQALTADMNPASVLDAVTLGYSTTNIHLSPRNVSGIGKFNILVDKTIEWQQVFGFAGGNGVHAMWEMYVPGSALEKIEVIANGSTVTRGGLMLIYMTGGDAATFQQANFAAYWELVYVDTP